MVKEKMLMNSQFCLLWVPKSLATCLKHRWASRVETKRVCRRENPLVNLPDSSTSYLWHVETNTMIFLWLPSEFWSGQWLPYINCDHLLDGLMDWLFMPCTHRHFLNIHKDIHIQTNCFRSDVCSVCDYFSSTLSPCCPDVSVLQSISCWRLRLYDIIPSDIFCLLVIIDRVVVCSMFIADGVEEEKKNNALDRVCKVLLMHKNPGPCPEISVQLLAYSLYEGVYCSRRLYFLASHKDFFLRRLFICEYTATNHIWSLLIIIDWLAIAE